jgi:hypothetical protein
VKVSNHLSISGTAGFGRQPQLISLNGRRPQFVGKWKTILRKTEDDPKYLKIDDNLNFWEIEDDLNFS